VGAQSHVVQISPQEFDLLKFEIEEAQRTLSQKQNELDTERTRGNNHRQQLKDQLTAAIQSEERATEDKRQLQATLDQAELDLHTVQNERIQVKKQKQNEIDTITKAAELVRINIFQQQIQQITQAADQQTALANSARDNAAYRILDAQAIRDQAALRETAAQAFRDQAVID